MSGSEVGSLPSATLAVEKDLHCICCHYNLRTLAWDASCPECNHPVSESFISDAELSRLGKVHGGLTLLLLSTALYLCVYLYQWAVHLWPAMHLVDAGVLGYCLLLIQVVGVFSVTRWASGRFSRDLAGAARIVAVGTIICVLLPRFGIHVPGIWTRAGLLSYSATVLMFAALDALVLVYLYPIVTRFRLNVRIWWIVAMTSAVVFFVSGEMQVCFLHQRGQTTWLSSAAVKSLNFLNVAANIGQWLAFVVFYYLCRRGLARLRRTAAS